MNKRVIIFISIFLLVFVGGFFTARSLFPASKEVNTTQRYATKPVTRSDIKQGVNLKGQLNGNWGGIISAPRPEGITDSNNAPVTVTFTVEEVFVEPNQFIKKGDNLIRLSANNLVEILEEITTDIQKKQKEIQEVNDSVRDKIDNLSNKINR